METNRVLYTRRFTGYGGLQEAHILQYALLHDAEDLLPYGVSITVLGADGQHTQSCGSLCGTAEDACGLLCYLYENAVEPQAMSGIIDDIKRRGILSR